MKHNRLLIGDALERLRSLPDASVDCVVTSPPYFGLRDYGVSGQLGQESHIDQWVAQVRAVCQELHRVLSLHGSLWLNLGDAYSTHPSFGAPAKSLLLGPERVAQALVGDGWLLRNKVVWAKTNPLPSPVLDRLTNSYEFIYFLTKQPSYFFDLDAIREPLQSKRPPSGVSHIPEAALGKLAGRRDGLVTMAREGRSGHPLGKNPGDVWRLGSAAYRGAHFATFPPELIRRPILSTCPPRVCVNCLRPWRRSTRSVIVKAGRPQPRPFVPCGCQAPTRRGLVLDPFFGSGTVATVARQHDRDWLGIELNPAYKPLAEARLGMAL
jgi:site-specific DNA-methyltransferase (adenine-specific)